MNASAYGLEYEDHCENACYGLSSVRVTEKSFETLKANPEP